MARMIHSGAAAVAASVLSALALVALGTASAEAVVYCKALGVPKGCVVRPAAPVVVAPAPVVVAPAPVVVAPRTTVVVPRTTVVVPGTVNRGGPVNRVGRR
jgi:hypothetical protein